MGEWSSVEQLCSEGFDIDTVLRSVIREWGIWSGLQWFSTTTCPPPVTSHTTCTGCNISEKMAYFIHFEMASFLWRVFVCGNNIYIYIYIYIYRAFERDNTWQILDVSSWSFWSWGDTRRAWGWFLWKMIYEESIKSLWTKLHIHDTTSSDCILHHDVWIRDV